MTDSFKIDYEVIHGGFARGKVFNHNTNEEYNTYPKRILKKIIKDIYRVIADEESQFLLMSSRFRFEESVLITSSQLVSMGYHMVEFKQKLRNKVCVEKMGIAKALKEAFYEYTEEFGEDAASFFHGNVKERFIRERQFFFDRLLVRTKKGLLHHKIKAFKEDTILCLDKFEIEYLDQIPKAIKGIITKEQVSHSKKSKYYCVSYNLPLIKYCEELDNNTKVIIDTESKKVLFNATDIKYNAYNHFAAKLQHTPDEKAKYILGKRRVNIFGNINDPRYKRELAAEGWFKGLGLIQTEIFYGVKGSSMDRNEVYRRIKQIIGGLPFDEATFQIPDFSPDKSLNLNGENEYLDIVMADEFEPLIWECILGIAMASKYLKCIKVAVPMIRDFEDFNYWRGLIEAAFLSLKYEIPKIGLIVETESCIDYCEHITNKSVDFSVIDLDDLIEELIDNKGRFDHLTFKEYIDHLAEYNQYAHQSFRLNKVDHGITGYALRQEEIMKRMLTKGYLNIYIAVYDIKKVEHVICEYLDQEGKYVNHKKKQEEQSAMSKKLKEENVLKRKTELRRRSRIYKSKPRKKRTYHSTLN
ncbi:MAG: putative PEP-binding protein [Acholeplasmataceae bacterium]